MADDDAENLAENNATDSDESSETAADAADQADAADEALELETFDLDGDGTISVVEAERARLGLVDARLEEIAEQHGLKGAIAEAAHKVLDKFDND